MLNKYKILCTVVISMLIGYHSYAQCPIESVIFPNDTIRGQNIITFGSNYFGVTSSAYTLPLNNSITGYLWTLSGSGGNFTYPAGNSFYYTLLNFTSTGIFTLTGTIYYFGCKKQTFSKVITVKPYCPILTSANSISGASFVSPSTTTSYTLGINYLNHNYEAYWFTTKWSINYPATIVSTINYQDYSYIKFPSSGIYTITTTSINRCNQSYTYTFKVTSGTVTNITDSNIDYGIYYDNGVLKSDNDIDWVISNERGDIMDSRKSSELDLRKYLGLVFVRTRYKTFKYFISNQ